MTKRLLVLTFLSFIFGFNSFAQCVPDASITVAGVYPDSTTGLAIGTQNVPYNQVLQIRVPLDTTVTIVIFGVPTTINVTIDSVHLQSFSGLPLGLSLSCSNPNCTFAGNTNGCADISGTPTDTGYFALTAILTTYAHPSGFPLTQVDTIQYYHIYVTGPTGLADNTANGFIVEQNTPNPFNDYCTVNYYLPHGGKADFKLTNLLGKQVYSSTSDANAGKNSVNVDARNLASGTYMYSLTFDNRTITKRLVIGNR